MNTLSYPANTVLLLVGTSQGLFRLTSRNRERWTLEATSLQAPNANIFYAVCDPRNHHRLFAADNRTGQHAFLRYSDDLGATWQEPAYGPQFSSTSEAALNEIWYIEPGRSNDPQTLDVGTGPANLWTSHDRGKSWELNTHLWQQSQQDHWENGPIGTCVHSIVADPTRPERMWLGISGAGSVRSEDHGKSWQTINQLAQPDPAGWTEVCSSTHRLLQHTQQPETLYQQSRCGLFRSRDAGNTWDGINNGLPTTFGFPLAMDANHPDTLFTLVVNPEDRYPSGEQFSVYRSQNAGDSWQACADGLPGGRAARLKVLRHGMCTDNTDPCGVYVGTMSGQLFASPDNGTHWQLIANHLPTIYSVTATIL
ncbi:glycosyl hydrolase [Dictyobacter alpinus]|uniref:Glycosyl hydrolase n=1 Tax=Dictyobacter alpinus TaxID=2014873 RepID=A0A402BJC2_9CHLR|nr:sialidase family protein [Dictyobacter alpinus]GCE31444.1 glycosyl hydrolase [Dictyobacter alpinus]